MIKLLKKHYEIVSYIFFGGCTTAVNFLTYFGMEQLGGSTLTSSVVAWLLSVLFAFVVNRKYVFRSEGGDTKSIFSELVKFVLSRHRRVEPHMPYACQILAFLACRC